MKRTFLAAFATLGAVSPCLADMPVIDRTNYAVARKTADTTSKILDTNKDILQTVEKTLGAVTGNRGSDAVSLKDLAIGNGFSVSSMPSFDKILQDGIPDFGSLNAGVVQAATTFINGLQLVTSLSGKQDSSLASDQSYQELMKTVLGVSAMINGSTQAVASRRSALERAGQGIGQASDVKGSIDQNTQLQVQTGLTLNELIGVLNAGVQSLQAENQRRLTDISNTRKALTYE